MSRFGILASCVHGSCLLQYNACKEAVVLSCTVDGPFVDVVARVVCVILGSVCHGRGVVLSQLVKHCALAGNTQ